MYTIGKAPIRVRTPITEPVPEPVIVEPVVVEEPTAEEPGQTTVEEVKIIEELVEEIPIPAQTQLSLEEPAAAPKPPSSAFNLGGFGEFFGKALEELIKEKAEELKPEVLEILKAELQKLKPTNIRITGRKSTGQVVGYKHKMFRESVFLCEQERQLMLVGPAGSGKTTLASQISEAFSIQFGHISCSAGMSEAHLLGRMLFDGTYVPSEFVKCYEQGGVFLFDEIDAADSNTLLVVNSALANGYMSVPNRKDDPIATRHEDFICIVAGNSWGYGSNSYQGRGYLDAAFLDRFAVCKIEIEYDEELERDIAGEHDIVLERMWEIRKIITQNRMKRIMSTRSIVSAIRQTIAGRSLKQIEKVFTTGWAKDEKRKIS